MKNLKKMSVAVLLAATVVGQTKPAAPVAVAVAAPIAAAVATVYGCHSIKGMAVQGAAPAAEVAQTLELSSNGGNLSSVGQAPAQDAAEKVAEATTFWTAKLKDGCSWVGAKMQSLWNSEKVQNVVNAEATQAALAKGGELVAWTAENKATAACWTATAVVAGAVLYNMFANDAKNAQEASE